VQDIRSVADEVQQLAPKARIAVGHGQMPPHELEEVMLRFMRRDADILVSTTIIESGIDNPSANTIIINDADRFGLSDLHQLRGRVGRSRHRAYCYLLLPLERTVKETAKKRLKALEQYAMLGAGFKIAMRDLEIRGAGNILGPEQSGHIAAVGYEMYCRLLEASVHTLKNEPAPEPPSTTSVEIGLSAAIPRAYIPSDPRRLAAYRRIAVAASDQELSKAVADITEAYGVFPASVQRLVDLAQLRIALHTLGCRAVSLREKDVIFLCKDAERLAQTLSARPGPGTVRALPPKAGNDLAEVYFRPPESYLSEPASLLTALRARLGLVAAQPAESGQRAPTREKSVLLTKSQPIR
jgi:transcription-repair coupling factor (superfamily II helicase)